MKGKNKYYTIWAVKNLLQNKLEKFMALLDVLLINKKYDELVRVIKRSEITIDKFGSGESRNKEYKKICEKLVEIKGAAVIDTLFSDVKIINEMYKAFYAKYMTPLEEHIPPEFQFSALLINLQLRMEMLQSLEREAPLFDITNGALELAVSHATTIIKFFHYKGYKLNYSSVTDRILEESSRHFETTQLRKSLDDLTTLWSLYGLRLYKNSSGQITFNLEEIEDAFNKSSSQLTYLDIKNNKMHRQGIESLLKIKKNTYISDAAEFIYEHYNIKNLQQQINGISLSEYIIAYKVIHELGKTSEQKQRQQNKYTIDNYLVIIPGYKIKKKMIKAGIASNNVDSLLEFLTFSARNSVDLYDTPLFKLDNNYVFVPFIARTIEPAAAIFSNFNSRDMEINIKGDDFEEKIKNTLLKSNIRSRSYKKSVSDEEFQCDLVFRLSDTVYFCELKHFKQPLTFWDYAVVKDKIYEASLQLDRIYDFYSREEQWEEIKQDFELFECESTIKMRKLIVTNISMNAQLQINETNITSEYKFYTYFNQIRPTMHQGRLGNMETVELDVFKARNSADVCSEDFEEYIKKNVLLDINKQRFSTEQIYYHDLNLLYEEYRLNIGTCTRKSKTERMGRIVEKLW